MGNRRQGVIARSVTHSIVHSDEAKPSLLARIPNFFWLYWLTFECIRGDLFTALRGIWHVDEHEYKASFGAQDRSKRSLVQMGTLLATSSPVRALQLTTGTGDMGFSGSTFFTTRDKRYIVKSIPRRFEHSFFKDDLVWSTTVIYAQQLMVSQLLPYSEYMQNNPNSLITRITDFLSCYQASVGTLLGMAPTHHLVMENLLYGKQDSWEDYDLKPMSYFYPERDIADGVLTSEATKSKLADDFNEKIVLQLDDAEDLKAQLEKDTKFLADNNAVDYSLMLVRIPASHAPTSGDLPAQNQTPLVPPEPPSWRAGVKSADGRYVYRAAILDFFWSKDKVHAKAMTALIDAYNTVDRQGPMSVTTNSPEYRNRFLKMVKDMIEEHE